jgi:hypothetical protein
LVAGRRSDIRRDDTTAALTYPKANGAEAIICQDLQFQTKGFGCWLLSNDLKISAKVRDTTRILSI